MARHGPKKVRRKNRKGLRSKLRKLGKRFKLPKHRMSAREKILQRTDLPISVRRQLIKDYHEQAFAGPLKAVRTGRRLGKKAKRGAHNLGRATLLAYASANRKKEENGPPFVVYNVIPEDSRRERVVFVSSEKPRKRKTRYAGHGRAETKQLSG